MTKRPRPTAEACVTCGDRAAPMRVLWVDGGAALVEDACGLRAEVSVELLARPRPGDLLLIHAGVALARVEEP